MKKNNNDVIYDDANDDVADDVIYDDANDDIADDNEGKFKFEF